MCLCVVSEQSATFWLCSVQRHSTGAIPEAIVSLAITYHLFTQNGIERGTIFASIASTDLLQEGKHDSGVHSLVSDGQVHAVGLCNVVDGVAEENTPLVSNEGRKGKKTEGRREERLARRLHNADRGRQTRLV